MTDKLDKLEVRIPLFGEQTIYLQNESRECYQVLKDLGEIDRLENKVMHLGIIHEIGDVPSFGRWVHIATMLTLIEEIKKRAVNLEALGFGFSNHVTLLNGTRFSSAEEFLKSWTMLYSLGHFVGTFTSEHALLRSIIPRKEEFTHCLIAEIDDLTIRDMFQKIVDKEEVFKVFKIFTTLKILKNFDDNKYIELAKVNLLEESYLEKIDDVKQRTKLESLLSFFKLVRRLSFTILDGYFSQNYVVVNHYYFLLNIDKMLRQKPYDQLLNNLNLFYTQTIYQSPENMFYHHEFAKVIEDKVFNTYSDSWDNLIQEIIENKIDEKIDGIIQDSKDEIRENRLGHFGRVILKSIDYPVSLEKEIFSDISGGIIWNIPAKYYEVDFYLDVSTLEDILRILKAVEKIYKRVEDSEEKVYSFEEISKNIVVNMLKIKVPGYEFACDSRKFGFYSVIFDKDNLDKVSELINERKEQQIDTSTEKELEMSKELLEEIVSENGDENIFTFSPNLISKKGSEVQAECDFLLTSFNSSTEDLVIYVSEIKKSHGMSSFRKEQIQKYLMYILGLDESLSESLASKLKETKSLDEKIDSTTYLYGDLSSNRFLLKMTLNKLYN